MKAKKQKAKLLKRQAVWDAYTQNLKNATTRPGSVKGK